MKIFSILYKTIAVLLLCYGAWRGLSIEVPYSWDLMHTYRNIFFHVPLWYVMMIMMIISVIYSLKNLNTPDYQTDFKAKNSALVGVVFALMGLVTGIVWSRTTWGAAASDSSMNAWWVWDPKQTFALLLIFIYIGYFILRNGIENSDQRGKVGAVFNIFAFALIIPCYFVLPKLMGGLHPGSGDDGVMSALKSQTATVRITSLIIALGYLGIGVWVLELFNRIDRVRLLRWGYA